MEISDLRCKGSLFGDTIIIKLYIKCEQSDAYVENSVICFKVVQKSRHLLRISKNNEIWNLLTQQNVNIICGISDCYLEG